MKINRSDMTVDIAKLAPYPDNARTHSDSQIAQIMRSIEEFGFTNPILLDESMTIIAGHGRVEAAKRLNLTSVPAVVLSGLTESQRRALVIADNQLALNAGWDKTILGAEIEKLLQANFNVDLLGFKPAELNRMLLKGFGGENEAPAASESQRSRLGDTWLLGKHRIRCGSSISADDVTALLAGASPNLMVTDPPYGVKYDPEWRNGYDNAKNRRTGAVENDDRADWREAWALFPGNIAYVWHSGFHSHTVAESLVACDFQLRSQIIWVKQQFVRSRSDYHWQHEPCWYAVRNKGNWTGDRKQTTVWEISNLNKIGAGAIAAESSGRICYAMELNPAYVDIAVRRWQQFTGQKATLESTGEEFDQTA